MMFTEKAMKAAEEKFSRLLEKAGEKKREEILSRLAQAEKTESADVIAAIREDRAPYVDGRAGMRALELVLAIYLSAAEHRPVRMPLADCATTDFEGRFGR